MELPQSWTKAPKYDYPKTNIELHTQPVVTSAIHKAKPQPDSVCNRAKVW